MVETLKEAPRLLPPVELPAYTFIPGSLTPHPYRHPEGHSYKKKTPPARPLTDETWADNRSFLLALDLFNIGYYWEAHEEFDRLLKITCPDELIGRFLKGLFKLAAAGLKVGWEMKYRAPASTLRLVSVASRSSPRPRSREAPMQKSVGDRSFIPL